MLSFYYSNIFRHILKYLYELLFYFVKFNEKNKMLCYNQSCYTLFDKFKIYISEIMAILFQNMIMKNLWQKKGIWKFNKI